jgi:hypothetical protein
MSSLWNFTLNERKSPIVLTSPKIGTVPMFILLQIYLAVVVLSKTVLLLTRALIITQGWLPVVAAIPEIYTPVCTAWFE